MPTTTQQLTLQDFLKVPNIEESPAWEFVDGQVYQKPMPTAHHSILQKRLTAVIDQADSPYEAFPKLRCTLSSNSVAPDITVIQQNRVPSENIAVEGAPDWMIEILSPDQSTTKLIAKIQTMLAGRDTARMADRFNGAGNYGTVARYSHYSAQKW
jgi:Uma2 family endonuclease